MQARTAFSSLALAAIVGAACAPSAAPTPTGGSAAPAEQRADLQNLMVAVPGIVGNPTPQASRTNNYQYWNLYDSLTSFGENYEVKPWIATKWENSADGLTWTFTIRSDVKFSNGDALTAEDVAFSLQEVFDQKWPQTSYFSSVTSVTAPNPTTVVMQMSKKDASIPSGGPFLWILPKKYYQAQGFNGFLAKPIGSGPYTLEEYRNADIMKFKRRADKHAFREPVSGEITIRVIPDNQQILNALIAGEVDMAINVGWSGDQAKLLQNRGLNVNARLASAVQVAMPQGSFELRDTPLKDRRVRIALQYAINKTALADVLYGGFAKATGQLAPPGTQFHDPSVQPYPHDPATARRLLAEAGYPNGFKLTGGFDYSSARGQQNMVISIQADLKAVGVEIEAIANEESVFVDKAYGRRDLPKGDLWMGSNNDDNGFYTGLRTFYGCGKPVGGPDRAKLYCNPAWDKALDDGYAEPDPAKRRAFFVESNRIFRQDVPALFVIDQSGYIISTPKTKGLIVPTANVYNLDSVYKIK